MKKIIFTALISLAIITLLSGISKAKDIEIIDDNYGKSEAIEFYGKEMVGEPNVGIVQTRSNLRFTPDSKTNSIASTVFGVVLYICLGALFIILVIKGVQFMAAAPEGKAEIKKQLIAIAIGAFIVFSIRAILTIISNLNLFN